MSLPKFSKQLELVSTTRTRLDLTEILVDHKKQIDDITHLELNDSVLKITFTDKSTVDTSINQLFDFSVPANRSQSIYIFGSKDNIRCTDNYAWNDRDHVNTDLNLEEAKYDKFHEDRFYRDYDDNSDLIESYIDDFRYDEYLYFDIDTRHLYLKSDHPKNEELHKTKTPIYAYIHSGVTISTEPFTCRWDSGVIGYVYHDFSEAEIESTISEINDYLTNDVWFDRYEENCMISNTHKEQLEANLEFEAKANKGGAK
jgi:hypothetical protein